MARKGKPVQKRAGGTVAATGGGASLRIRVPGAEEKGYVRRMKQLGLIQRGMENGDFGVFADLVEFLKEYSEADEGVDIATAIEDMSQSEFTALFEAFADGKIVNP